MHPVAYSCTIIKKNLTSDNAVFVDYYIFSDIFFLILLVVQNDRDSGISYAV